MIYTVNKKWLIIGGVIGASIAGVFGGLYLAGYMVRKTTEHIIQQIQTTPPPTTPTLPPTTLSTPPTQTTTAPPPSTTTQQLTQTQNQQQQQQQLPPIQVGGFIPSSPPTQSVTIPSTTCTGTCPYGTIPMKPGIANMAGCPVITTVCGVVCVPNGSPCISKANQLEAQLSIYTSPQYTY